MAFFSGDSGDNSAFGGGANDTFVYDQGGQDSLFGGGGADLFYFGAAFSTGDRAVGDTAIDTVELSGDYSAGFTIGLNQFVSIDVLTLDAGGTYDLTLTDVSAPTPGFILEAYGASIIRAGGSTNALNLRVASAQVIFMGGAGDDAILTEENDMPRTDRLDGGAGDDTVYFQAAPHDFRAAARTFANIEHIVNQDISQVVMHDGNLAAGLTMTYQDQLAGSQTIIFDAHKERDGHYDMSANNSGAVVNEFRGGHLSDTLDGGAGDDLLTGGQGGDQLTGGDGADRFVYLAVKDSVGAAADLITDLQDGDQIDLTGIDADRHTHGRQSFAVVEAFTHHGGELVWSYDSGGDVTTLSGDVDGDGVADLVIHMSGEHTDFSGLLLSAT